LLEIQAEVQELPGFYHLVSGNQVLSSGDHRPLTVDTLGQLIRRLKMGLPQ
jgi:hypothetical protein